MERGLLWECDKFELRCEGTISVVSHNDFSLYYHVTTETQFLDRTAGGINRTGAILEIDAKEAYNYGNVQFRIPYFSQAISYSGSFVYGLTARVEIDNLKVYMRPNGLSRAYETQWGTVRLYVNSAVVGTLNPGTGIYSLWNSAGTTIDYIQPADLPIFGVPATLSAGFDVSTDNPFGEGRPVHAIPYGTSNQTHDYTLAAAGGWRYTIGTTIYTPPVTLSIQEPPNGACTGTAARPSFSASDTWNGNISVQHKQTLNVTNLGTIICDICPDGSTAVQPELIVGKRYDYDGFYQAANITLTPDVGLKVQRVNDDYRALILRSALPQIGNRATEICYNTCSGTAIEYSGTAGTVWVTRGTATVFEAGTAVTAEELAVFGTVHAPYYYKSFYEESHVDLWLKTQDPICGGGPGDPPAGVFSGGAELDALTGRFILYPGEQLFASFDMSHVGAGNAITTCQPDGGLAEKYGGWVDNESCFNSQVAGSAYIDDLAQQPDLDATYYNASNLFRYFNYACNPHVFFHYHYEGWSSLNKDTYWKLLREQYLNSDSYGSTAGYSHIRNHIPTLNSFANWRNWGIRNFSVETPAPAGSVVLNSASSALWSVTGGSLTFGGSITVNPSGTGLVSIDLLLNSTANYQNSPYFYPHICGSAVLGWGGTALTGVNLYLVNAYGDRVSLGTAPGTLARPTTTENKFAGSWGNSSRGADTASGGKSSDIASAWNTNDAYSLLTGWGAHKLTIECTHSETVPFSIAYPVFILGTVKGRAITETGQTNAVVFPNAGGIRHGQLNVWDDVTGTLRDYPTKRDMGGHPDLVDWWVWQNVYYAGSAGTAGLLAKAAARFNRYEGTTLADVAAIGTVPTDTPGVSVLARHTYPVMLDSGTVTQAGYVWTVNSLSESLYPHNALPKLRRDSAWNETGTILGQYSYSAAFSKRNLINAQSFADLVETSGSVWTTHDSTIVPGWYLSTHAHTVNNADAQLIVKVSDRPYASVYPWHGYFMEGTPGTAQGLSYDVSPSMRHARAFVSEGTIILETAKTYIPQDGTAYWDTKNSGISGNTPSIRYERGLKAQNLYCAYDNGSAIVAIKTGDEGQSWGTVGTIFTGATNPNLCITRDNRKFYFAHNGTGIVGAVYDAWDNVQIPLFTAIETIPVDNMCSQEFNRGNSQWMLGLAHREGSAVVVSISFDGTAFVTTGTVFGTAQYPTMRVSYDGRFLIYARLGTAIIGRLYDNQGNPMTPQFTAIGTIDVDAIATGDFVTGGGAWHEGLLFRNTGTIMYRSGTDGTAFN